MIRRDEIAHWLEHFRKNSLDMISNYYEMKKLADTVEDRELKILLQNNIVCLFLSVVYRGDWLIKDVRTSLIWIILLRYCYRAIQSVRLSCLKSTKYCITISMQPARLDGDHLGKNRYGVVKKGSIYDQEMAS